MAHRKLIDLVTGGFPVQIPERVLGWGAAGKKTSNPHGSQSAATAAGLVCLECVNYLLNTVVNHITIWCV